MFYRKNFYVFVLAGAVLTTKIVSADTLKDVFLQARLNNYIDRVQADQSIASYDTYQDEDFFLIGYYRLLQEHPDHLDENLHLILINKKDKAVIKDDYNVEELIEKTNIKDLYYLGSILDIKKAGAYFYLQGHLNPSASPTLVVSETLECHDVLPGWVIEVNDDQTVVYRHNMIHFVPEEWRGKTRFSRYDPVTKESSIYWTKEQALRSIELIDPIDGKKSKAELSDAVTESRFNETNLFISVHEAPQQIGRRPAIARIFSQKNEKLELLEHLIFEIIERRPSVFHYSVEGESYPRQFIQITEVSPGTGHFTTEHVYEVVYDGELDLKEVEFIPAAVSYQPYLNEGEGVWKGVHSKLNDNLLAFEFYIWKEGDANCCPSAGKVRGTYKILSGEDQHKPLTIVMDKFERMPVEE